MTETTANLSLPYILSAQAQKHVTHNEAVELLDLIVQMTLEGVDETIPPGAPSEGQSWALGAAPSGDWSGNGGQIASWRGGGWLYVTPQTGWMAWVKNVDALQVYTGGAWSTLASISP